MSTLSPKRILDFLQGPSHWDFLGLDTIDELSRFLRMFHFFRCCTLKAAGILALLNEPLRGLPVKDKKSHPVWTAEGKAAFQSSQTAQTGAITTSFLSSNDTFALRTNGSNTPIDTSLEHEFAPGAKRSLGFFSRKLSNIDGCYGAFHQGLLPVRAAVKCFYQPL